MAVVFFEARAAGNIYALPGDVVTFTAGTGGATKGRFVRITGPMTVSNATGKTDAIIGVAAESAAAGRPVPVVISCPIVYMLTGGATTAGAPLSSDSVGRAATPTWAAGDGIGGFALESAAGADAVILVAVNPHVY